jgi:hypothetical protein
MGRALEVSMPARSRFLLLFVTGLGAAGCGSDSVQTGSVEVKYNQIVDFSQFQTFSVVTKDLVDFPDLEQDQQAFNNMVNDLIVQAMQAEPVCMTLISPETVTEQNQPDLWAANGLRRSTESGYVYECCGGWWWGYWGWYWDPCAYGCPTYVEYDVGTLLIPVGRPSAGQEAEVLFAGLAQSILNTGPDVETKVREAVQAIFAQWPVKRTCNASQ